MRLVLGNFEAVFASADRGLGVSVRLSTDAVSRARAAEDPSADSAMVLSTEHVEGLLAAVALLA